MKRYILILLMLLDSATLTQISTKNILSVSLVQSQLETNFELILKALQNHDSLLKDHNGKIASLEEKVSKNINLQLTVEELDKKMKVEFQGVAKKHKGNCAKIAKLEESLSEYLRINPQAEKKNEKKEKSSELIDLITTLQEKMQKVEGSVNSLDKKIIEIDSLSNRQGESEVIIDEISKKMKEEEATLLRVVEEIQKIKAEMSSLSSPRQRKQSAKINSNSDTDAEIKKLNINVTTIKEEFNKFSIEISEKIELLSKNVGPIRDKETQDEIVKKLKKMSDDIWKLNQQLYVSDKHSREVEVANQAVFENIFNKIKELWDSIDHLKSDHTSHKTIVSARQPATSECSPQNTLPELQNNEFSPKKEEQKDLESQNFKRDILEKLKQQRNDFNKAIKRLDNVSNRKEEEDISKLNELQERIMKLEHKIDGKVDEDGMKKWMKYIENKIGYLYRIENAEVNEEDAYIARKNWNCLSCDKKLEAYRGKVGTHLISAQLKSKGVDQDVIGGGMLFKAKSKYELPQFKK